MAHGPYASYGVLPVCEMLRRMVRWFYGYGAFKLQPFVDGLAITDCAVDTEDVTFGSMKALYR